MYKSIVRRRYRRAWRAMNAHDYQVILDQLAPDFHVTFVGDTPLGGTRTGVESMAAWFERLFRFFPDARFELRALSVDGPPWNTRVAGLFTIRATVAGDPYENVFAQFVRLRFGRITWYEVYEDSLKFGRLCDRLAVAGNSEATAEPIADTASPVFAAA